MLPDWIVAVMLLGAYVLGFMDAWAICNRDKPLWRGWWDGRTCAFIWRRRR